MSKNGIIFLLALGLVLAIFNPSKEKMVEAIKTDHVDSTDSEIEEALASLTKGIVGLSAQVASYEDYVIFSTLSFNDKTYIGVAGQVFSI